MEMLPLSGAAFFICVNTNHCRRGNNCHIRPGKHHLFFQRTRLGNRITFTGTNPYVLQKTFSVLWNILKRTFVAFTANDPLRMAGATAFFTSFALPAILIIIVRTLGLFVDRKVLGQKFAAQLTQVFGAETAASISQTIRSFLALQHNLLITSALFLFLIFVATTLFKVIKGSINEIWGIRKSSESGIVEALKSRAIAVVVILCGGLLFLAAQLVDAGQHMLGHYFKDSFPQAVFYGTKALYQVIAIGVSTVWFYLLFSFLPDARPARRVAWLGALITALLFNAGKWVLGFILKPGNVSSFYGASGAIVLLLLFVFYSSIILYCGAAFIRAWSDLSERPLLLKAHAVKYDVKAMNEAMAGA